MKERAVLMRRLFTHPERIDDDSEKFSYRLTSCNRVNTISPRPTPCILLIGGREEDTPGEDAATRWFLKNADRGNYLVLRSGEIGKQADWVCDDYRKYISSSAELSINHRKAANNPRVIQYIHDAEALFIAGGDQTKYEQYWEGSAVEEAINYLVNHKKVPIGGTSAGMAILGDYYYAPTHEGVLSSEILNNPFHPNTKDIYYSDFIKIPILRKVITDTHLDRIDKFHPEPRYGRIFGFLARVVHENHCQFPFFGIGLDQGVFVSIDDQGIAKVFGNGRGAGAYFLQTNGAAPERIQRDLPLIWNNHGQAVKVYKISGDPQGSGHFDLNDWLTASGGTWEYWFTTGGMSGFTRKPIA